MVQTPPPPVEEIERIGRATVVRLADVPLVDEQTIQTLVDHLAETADNFGPCPLVVNCATVQQFASLLLAKLLGLRRRLQTAGARLVLCEPPAPLAETLRRMRLAELFALCASEQEAVGM
jgi:anti-anti-sigma regulatory factor